MEHAKRLLARLGVREKMALESLQDQHYVTKRPCWAVYLTAGRRPGWVSVVLDARTGRALFIQAPFNPAIARASNEPPTPQSTRRAWALLRALGYDTGGVRLQADIGFSNGPYMAMFHRTAHGHRFFNINPTYGHRLWFEPGSGAINYFSPSLPLPEVNARTPRVEPAAALAKISGWARERARRKHKESVLSLGGSEQRAELGYWKFAREPRARLVWRAARYIRIKGLPYGLGSWRVFADAVTGELVEPDDPAMGENP